MSRLTLSLRALLPLLKTDGTVPQLGLVDTRLLLCSRRVEHFPGLRLEEERETTG